MSENYTDRLYNEYSSQRDKMHDASLEAAGRYDRAILTITTGVMALSITFIDKIVKTPDEGTILLLVFSWILLLVSLISELLALSSSQKACQRQIEILDEEYSEYFYSENEPEEAVLKRSPHAENVYKMRTRFYSSVALGALILGIIFLMAISTTNIYSKGSVHVGKTGVNQKKRQHGGQASQGQLHTGKKQTPTTAP